MINNKALINSTIPANPCSEPCPASSPEVIGDEVSTITRITLAVNKDGHNNEDGEGDVAATDS